MKKIVWAIASVSYFMIAATGCGKSTIAVEITTAAESTAESTASVEDPEDVTEIDLGVPGDAENVQHYYLAEGKMSQVTFNRGKQSWVYIAAETDDFKDISGMPYDWNSEEEVTVSGRRAVLYDYSSEKETVWMINWYDVAPGIMYSLRVTAENGEDLDGLDMQGMAESLFVPMQDEADSDVAETAQRIGRSIQR